MPSSSFFFGSSFPIKTPSDQLFLAGFVGFTSLSDPTEPLTDQLFLRRGFASFPMMIDQLFLALGFVLFSAGFLKSFPQVTFPSTPPYHPCLRECPPVTPTDQPFFEDGFFVVPACPGSDTSKKEDNCSFKQPLEGI